MIIDTRISSTSKLLSSSGILFVEVTCLLTILYCNRTVALYVHMCYIYLCL